MKRNYLLLFCLVLFATKSFSQEVKKIASDNKSKILRKNDAIQDFSRQLDNVRTFQPSGVYVFKLNWTFAKRVFS